ncbi:hypothetical protein N4T20_20700 [Flavobacterium sp. TR2]|uniref:hypothetical protein n=1 Tax=Flavobacterium sp. TR2 TaxID=2977321 RepID=UPI0021B0D9C4|nr:hypothetical protein [Flavobacterium sp. TR2]UWY28129.1 hypothetical protein N4T20_20700 [Flavobacterium sp. TR2]
MIKNLLLLMILQINICSSQNKNCFCDENKLMNESSINCDTIKLKNNYNLYWQFNCDRIWLTIEKPNKSKIVINEVDVNLYPYTYRLGYQLIKDYSNKSLFRSGCSANGLCKFILINKKNGKKIKEYFD